MRHRHRRSRHRHRRPCRHRRLFRRLHPRRHLHPNRPDTRPHHPTRALAATFLSTTENRRTVCYQRRILVPLALLMVVKRASLLCRQPPFMSAFMDGQQPRQTISIMSTASYLTSRPPRHQRRPHRRIPRPHRHLHRHLHRHRRRQALPTRARRPRATPPPLKRGLPT